MPTFASALFSAYPRRSLIRSLIRREMASRYRGSALGRLWPFLTPMLMLAVFTFVFGAVFKSRWPGLAEGGLLSFALVLLAGLLVHALMAEMLSPAPASVLQHPNYVKKVVFPLETLGWVQLGVASVHTLSGFALLVAINAVFGSGLSWSVLAVPLLLLPMGLMMLGLHWCLAALGVYLRDLGQLLPPVLTALMFLGPVFYPREQAPAPLGDWLVLNPITFVVEGVRAAIFHGQWPSPAGWGCYLAVSVLAYCAGLAVFQKLRKGFADVV